MSVILQLFEAPESLASFDYYIGPSGSNTNDGLTASTPWAITSLVNPLSSSSTSQAQTNRALMAGKRVGLLDGTYFVAALAAGINDPDNLILEVPNGSSGAPTIIEAVNSRLAIIDGTDGSGNRANFYYASSAGVIGQSYIQSGTGNITIKNLVIRKGYRYLVHLRYAGAIQDGPRRAGVLIEGCEIHDINNTGASAGDNISCIQAYTTDGMIVRNCKIYNARGESGAAANGYGIQTWSCDNSVFEYNSITDCKDGIYVKNAYQNGVTIHGNFIDLTDYTGGGSVNGLYGMDYGDSGVQHVDCHHNVVKAQNPFRVHDLSMRLNGPSQIYSNTFIALGTSFGVVGIQTYGNTQPIDFFDNILYRSGSSTAEEGDVAYSAGNTSTKFDYNCYPTSPRIGRDTDNDSYPNTTHTTLGAMTSASGYEANSITGDPVFVASGSGADYYQLQGGSPCKNTGKSDGTSGGSNVDMGAWGNSAPITIGCNF